jgi:hypothetical protein
MRVTKILVAQLLVLGLASSGAGAQDSPDSGGAPAAGAGEAAAPVNPVQGLFTPQPQYPTAQSQANPDPTPPTGGAGGANPLGALFNMGASPNAPAAAYNAPDTPKGENPLQGFFTGQPQFVTPQTLSNPDPTPKVPGPYGTEAKENTATAENGDKTANPAGDGNTAKEEDKTAGDKDKAEGKEGKDKTASEEKDKDKEAKGEDKDKEKDKDKEAKGEDKDKEKTAEDGDKEKSKDKNKKAEKEEELPPPGAYNALKEAIALINGGQPGQALSLLGGITKQYPGQAQAHYLSAVALVTLRNYDQAAEEYRAVIRLVPTTSLAQRAADGLKKIGAAPPAVTLPPLRMSR